MQNIPWWKKSDRGSSHFRHGLDPRLKEVVIAYAGRSLNSAELSYLATEKKTSVALPEIPDMR